mmetsp:Transcript_31968/g.95317  ORF Transcript_31968/g.95317 Transcript_31968/m.95317 type:complete len:211 (-) Transcript_31968:2115-2747(-)
MRACLCCATSSRGPLADSIASASCDGITRPGAVECSAKHAALCVCASSFRSASNSDRNRSSSSSHPSDSCAAAIASRSSFISACRTSYRRHPLRKEGAGGASAASVDALGNSPSLSCTGSLLHKATQPLAAASVASQVPTSPSAFSVSDSVSVAFSSPPPSLSLAAAAPPPPTTCFSAVSSPSSPFAASTSPAVASPSIFVTHGLSLSTK